MRRMSSVILLFLHLRRIRTTRLHLHLSRRILIIRHLHLSRKTLIIRHLHLSSRLTLHLQHLNRLIHLRRLRRRISRRITANRYHFENLKRLPRDVLKEASLLSGYNLMPAYILADLRGLKSKICLVD